MLKFQAWNSIGSNVTSHMHYVTYVNSVTYAFTKALSIRPKKKIYATISYLHNLFHR